LHTKHCNKIYEDERLTWYEQFPQTGEPSESSNKLVSAVTRSLHLAHRKQSVCQSAALFVSTSNAALSTYPKATTTPPLS
jgi:hypothetical protein